jgi:predicted Zn-dependent protease
VLLAQRHARAVSTIGCRAWLVIVGYTGIIGVLVIAVESLRLLLHYIHYQQLAIATTLKIRLNFLSLNLKYFEQHTNKKVLIVIFTKFQAAVVVHINCAGPTNSTSPVPLYHTEIHHFSIP